MCCYRFVASHLVVKEGETEVEGHKVGWKISVNENVARFSYRLSIRVLNDWGIKIFVLSAYSSIISVYSMINYEVAIRSGIGRQSNEGSRTKAERAHEF